MSIVFKTPKSALNTTSKAIQNLGSGECPEPVLEKAELEYTQNGEYTVTPEQGVDGFSSIDVTVNIPSDVNNQNKTVNPSTSQQTVVAEEGYSGLGTVTVNAVTAAIDPNIQAENILDGVTILGVTGTDLGYQAGYDEGEVAGEAAGYQNGYDDGYAQGQSECPEPPDPPILDPLSVTPSTSAQTIYPEEGVDGFSDVSVAAVTAAIDQNITAGNIKSGVTILGVSGSYDPQPTLSNLNITPSTNAQEYNPAISGVDGYSLVRVSAVTSAIDNNITAGNIKKNVSILGVTGTYDPQPSSYAGEFIADTVGTLTFDPDPNDGDYFSDVTVEVSADGVYGSMGFPFDPGINEQIYNEEITYTNAFYSIIVDSGSIDSQTGQYVAEDEFGNTINIEPFYSNPDYDENDPNSREVIIPPDFDLVGKTIVVGYEAANASVTEDTITIDPEMGETETIYIINIDNAWLCAVNQDWNPIDWYNDFNLDNYENEYVGSIVIGKHYPEEKNMSGEEDPEPPHYFSSVDVLPSPCGSFWNPFDNSVIEALWNADFENGFINMIVYSGSIDSQTGQYVAEDQYGNVFHIDPYMDNPDYDPEDPQPGVHSHIFPQDFDLVDKEIVVEFNKIDSTVNIDDSDPNEDPIYTIEIDECALASINWNTNSDTWLIDAISASTRSLSLITNEPQQMSISVSEPWEIEIDEPNRGMRSLAKSGLRDAEPEPTIEINQMEGGAGVYTLNVLSTTDQNTGFTIRGLNSGTELRVAANSLGDYLTIESLEDDNTVIWESFDDEHTLEYSIDEGETWETTTLEASGSTYIYRWNLDTDDKILLRGNNERYSDSTNPTNKHCRFQTAKQIDVYGSLASLLSSTNFQNYQLEIPYVFYGLFKQAQIVNADCLVLPVNVSPYCYSNMFFGCSVLETAPDLPATNLSNYCYSSMFSNCSSLIMAPTLPAKVLADYCYYYMFKGCSTLVETPELPARFLSNGCYTFMFQNCTSLETFDNFQAESVNSSSCQGMFWGCTALENVPASLPETISNNSFESMFRDCTSLTEAPELPATTLGQACYSGMFQGCTSLETAPELPATTLQHYCYMSMFSGCTSLTTAPELPAQTLKNQSYQEMFKNCSNIDEITCLATNISASNCVNGWLDGVAASGTFYKDSTMAGWTAGTNVPSGWTITDYVAQ